METAEEELLDLFTSHRSDAELPFPWTTTRSQSPPEQVSVGGTGGHGDSDQPPKRHKTCRSTALDPTEHPWFNDIVLPCQSLGCIAFNVPKPGIPAGSVLKHAHRVLESLFAKQWPCIYKIGFTHNPFWRWTNGIYGYKDARDGWTNMVILYVSHEPFGPAMLEASLIHTHFGSPGCRNVKSGGDTATPPCTASENQSWYATYIVYRSYKYPPPIPKASCRSTIEAAKEIVADLGAEGVARSGGLAELANRHMSNTERNVQAVVTKKFHLSLPVERSYLETSDPTLKVPVLKPSTWANLFVRNNIWHALCGLLQPDPARERAILESFWANFKEQNPSHDVFRLASTNQLRLDSTLPICYHGDEGRGRKHQAFLVVSWRSLLGRGLEPGEVDKKAKRVRKTYIKQKCNYKGHSYTTRFMIAGLRKIDYTGNRAEVFDALMNLCANEAFDLATSGIVDVDGRKRWIMLLYMTGDWPWLHKSGGFTRSFHNVQKRQAQRVFAGICHQCRAGQPGVLFEQFQTTKPDWLDTEWEENAFSAPSPFQRVPHDQGRLESMWVFDLFHTLHLGCAKVFLGGALALLSMAEEGRNVDVRFQALTTRYTEWCRAHKKRAHILKLSKECIGWPTTKDYPCGTWHKGALSTILLKFVESTLTTRSFDDNVDLQPLLKLVQEAAVAINTSIGAMYRADFWLSTDECNHIAGHGLRFLRRYSMLANKCSQQNMNLFVYTPKFHALQKIYLRVYFAGRNNSLYMNPLAVSVQQCEDFIGRPSRLSRRVCGGDYAAERVLDRYLLACYPQWISRKYLVRPT